MAGRRGMATSEALAPARREAFAAAEARLPPLPAGDCAATVGPEAAMDGRPLGRRGSIARAVALARSQAGVDVVKELGPWAASRRPRECARDRRGREGGPDGAEVERKFRRRAYRRLSEALASTRGSVKLPPLPSERTRPAAGRARSPYAEPLTPVLTWKVGPAGRVESRVIDVRGGVRRAARGEARRGAEGAVSHPHPQS